MAAKISADLSRLYCGPPAIVHVSNVELQDSLNGMLPAGEKILPVLEAMGDDKIPQAGSFACAHPAQPHFVHFGMFETVEKPPQPCPTPCGARDE